ncbi:MAG: response regulator transcription factor [Anaerolineae bacterium]|jgi:two-component system nitrate/nitrite response regulator NarL|nr:response regulator transcription factor [Anaerolineae bacterium]
MSEQTIKVLIVDDHEVVLRSIQALVSREPDMEIVATAVSGHEAIELAQQQSPDVIVMDVSMPILDGIRAAGEMKKRGVTSEIIMLSMHYSTALIQQARRNGASGYIVKQQANSQLIPAIRAAYEGNLSL